MPIRGCGPHLSTRLAASPAPAPPPSAGNEPMITACIAGGIGGAMVGAVGTHCNSFAFPSFLTCVVYVGEGFGVFLLSMVVGFAVAFGLIFLQKRKISELIGEKNI